MTGRGGHSGSFWTQGGSPVRCLPAVGSILSALEAGQPKRGCRGQLEARAKNGRLQEADPISPGGGARRLYSVVFTKLPWLQGALSVGALFPGSSPRQHAGRQGGWADATLGQQGRAEGLQAAQKEWAGHPLLNVQSWGISRSAPLMGLRARSWWGDLG